MISCSVTDGTVRPKVHVHKVAFAVDFYTICMYDIECGFFMERSALGTSFIPLATILPMVCQQRGNSFSLLL